MTSRWIDVGRNGSRLSRSFPYLIGRSRSSRSRSIYRGRPGFPPFVRSFFDPPSHRFENPPTRVVGRYGSSQPVHPSCRSCVWRPDLRGVLRGYRAMNDDGTTTDRRRDDALRCDTRPSPDRSDRSDHPDRSVDRTRRAPWVFRGYAQNLGRVAKKSLILVEIWLQYGDWIGFDFDFDAAF